MDEIIPVELSIPEFGEDSLISVDAAEAAEFGEAPVQLRESCSYQYEISPGFRLKEIPGVVMHLKVKGVAGGRITAGDSHRYITC